MQSGGCVDCIVLKNGSLKEDKNSLFSKGTFPKKLDVEKYFRTLTFFGNYFLKPVYFSLSFRFSLPIRFSGKALAVLLGKCLLSINCEKTALFGRLSFVFIPTSRRNCAASTNAAHTNVKRLRIRHYETQCFFRISCISFSSSRTLVSLPFSPRVFNSFSGSAPSSRALFSR